MKVEDLIKALQAVNPKSEILAIDFNKKTYHISHVKISSFGKITLQLKESGYIANSSEY